MKHTRVHNARFATHRWELCVALVGILASAPALAEREVSLAFTGSVVTQLQKDWPGAVGRYRQLEKTQYVRAGKPLLVRIPGMSGRFEAGRLDALLAAGPTRLTIMLPDIGKVVAVGDRARPSKLAPRLRIWQGKVTVGAGEDILDAPAIVAWDDRSLRIDVDMPGRIIRVRTMAPDTFTLYTVDTRGLPPDHEPRKLTPAKAGAKGKAGKGAQDGTSESGTRPPVKFGAAKPMIDPGRLVKNGQRVVLHAAFAFTREGAEEILNDDPSQGTPGQASLEQALVTYAEMQAAKANAALADSGVDAELQVVAVTPFALNEPAGNTQASSMNKLMPASSTHAADLHCWWGRAGKDPGTPKEKPGPANLLFLVGSFGGPAAAGQPVKGICGMSWKPHGTYVTTEQLAKSLEEVDVNDPNSLQDLGTGYYGYAILKNACVEQHLSLLHELGHILGTDHQRETGQTTAVGGAEPLVLDFVPQTKSFGFGSHNPSMTRVTVEVVGDDLRAHRSARYSNPLLAPAGKWGTPTRNSVKLMNFVAPVFGQRTPPVCR